jgi:uncharacterized protein with HEPN domain
MTERNLGFFLDDLIEAITKIQRYTKGMDFKRFKKNELVVDAVIRNLEVIGEAATHIPNNIKENYSELSWKRIIGLRNIAIHGYFKVDLNIIWKIITKNIPEMMETIIKIKEEFLEGKKND